MTAALWFLDTQVKIRVSCEDGTDGLSVIEHCAGPGDSPPLHSHAEQDEIFHVLDGAFRFRVDDEDRRVGPGATLLVPRGAVHSYRVESAEGGRYLTITSGSAFERFVRAVSRPATSDDLPPVAGPPTPEAMATLTGIAAKHGITFHGPPLERCDALPADGGRPPTGRPPDPCKE